jgi:hypothetical protein
MSSIHLKVFAALVAVTVGLAVSSSASAGWTVETVVSAGDVGSSLSMDMDGSGNPHIVYRDRTASQIKYIVKTGATWGSPETVVNSGYYNTDVVLDSSSSPHVSYANSSSYQPSYAYKSGGVWQTAAVSAVPTDGCYTSIALGQDGLARISYGYSVLKYATWNGTAFTTETADSATSVGRYNSLAIDSQGRPHIAYYDSNFLMLRYAVKTGTTWTPTAIDSGDAGYNPSLALDASDLPRIAYYDKGNENLKYAYYDGTNWGKETVDGGSPAYETVGKYSSLAIDSAGRPHIAYYDYSMGTLKYARWDGSQWAIETIIDPDGSYDYGVGCSLHLDALDVPHIAYYDSANGDLKYAVLPEPATLGLLALGGLGALLRRKK